LIQTTRDRRISWTEKIGFASGAFGIGICTMLLRIHLVFFYSDIIGLTAGLVGIAALLANGWDAVSDPAMGVISDRTRSRFGRRRIYLLVGAVPLALFTFLVWSPPTQMSHWMLFFYVLGVLFVLFTFITVCYVPHMALGAELSHDPHQRAQTYGARYIAEMSGSLVAATVPLVYLERAGNARAGYAAVGGVTGVVIVALLLVSFFTTRERTLHGLTPESGSGQARGLGAVLDYYRDLLASLRNRPLWYLLAAAIAVEVGTGITYTLMRFVAKYWLDMEELQPLLFLVYMVAAMLSVPMWVGVSKRFGKKYVYIFSQFVIATVLFLVVFLEPGRVIRVFALMVAGGWGIGGYSLLPALIADLADLDEYQRGVRREGSFFGLYSLCRKGSMALGILVATKGLDIIGYVPDIADPERIVPGLRFLFGPLTALITLLGALIFLKFPFTKARHEQIQAALRERDGERNAIAGNGAR
jgi:GPH family glycoside/pentoside/hexuronide:cation symporter